MCFPDQIMAIGTLSLCYDNVQVFRGVVKVRRGKNVWLNGLLEWVEDSNYGYIC